jgi:formate hydrogenlyase subunit 4
MMAGAAALFHLMLLLLAPPLLAGVTRKVKARLQNRQGPPLLQGYWNIGKLLRKSEVVSERASWITRIAPAAILAYVIVAGLLTPLWTAWAPLGFAGDAVLFIYLLAGARFFQTLMALDAGSSFGGMGASREAALGVLAEPALLLVLAAGATVTGEFSLAPMAGRFAAETLFKESPAYFLALLALLMATLTECARMPVDDPTTHLELTMVHEAMLLEASGPSLALLEMAAGTKLLLYFSLVVNLFIPWGSHLPWLPAAGLYLAEILTLAALLGVFESAVAKFRFFTNARFLSLASASGLLAVIAVVFWR